MRPSRFFFSDDRLAALIKVKEKQKKNVF